jgi:hypothetical protein
MAVVASGTNHLSDVSPFVGLIVSPLWLDGEFAPGSNPVHCFFFIAFLVLFVYLFLEWGSGVFLFF